MVNSPREQKTERPKEHLDTGDICSPRSKMETLNGEGICYWIVPLQDTLSKRMRVSKEELGGEGMLRKDLYKANAGSSPPTAGKSVLRLASQS